MVQAQRMKWTLDSRRRHADTRQALRGPQHDRPAKHKRKLRLEARAALGRRRPRKGPLGPLIGLLGSAPEPVTPRSGSSTNAISGRCDSTRPARGPSRPTSSAIHHWGRVTGDPPLAEISTQTLLRFREKLLQAMGGKQPGSTQSPTTVRKTLRHVQAVLDKAGPAGPRNRDAANLIPGTGALDRSRPRGGGEDAGDPRAGRAARRSTTRPR